MARQASNRQPANRQPTNRQPEDAAPLAAAALSGTAVAGGVTEAEIVTGGETVIVTLTNAVWLTLGATFDAIRQDIINRLTASSAPTNGFNNLVRDVMAVTAVVRTSDTVVTITLPAAAAYAPGGNESIPFTVPASAVDEAIEIPATPSIVITAASSGDAPGSIRRDIYDSIRAKQSFQITDIDRDYAANG